MPTTAQGSLFAAGSHTSWKAAVASDKRRGAKMRAYLCLLGSRGPVTDHEAAHALTLPLSSICSIRNGAMTAQLVTKAFETRMGPYGHENQVWDLTREGQAAVPVMRG